MATDSILTFAIFIYENPDGVLNITASGTGSVGFDAGDLRRSSDVAGAKLRRVNVFRLDGMNIVHSWNGHRVGERILGACMTMQVLHQSKHH